MYHIRDKMKALMCRESQIITKPDPENLADKIEKELNHAFDKEAYAVFILYRKDTEILLDRYGPAYAFLLGQVCYTHGKKLPVWDKEFLSYKEVNERRMKYLEKLKLTSPLIMRYHRLCTLALDFCMGKYKEWFLQGFSVAKVQEEIKILE